MVIRMCLQFMLDIYSQSQTLLQDMPVSLMKPFFGKKQNFWSWGYSPQVPDYQNLQIFRHQIKGILLYYQINVFKQTTIVEIKLIYYLHFHYKMFSSLSSSSLIHCTEHRIWTYWVYSTVLSCASPSVRHMAINDLKLIRATF